MNRVQFIETDVTVGPAPWALPGTLTFPTGAPGPVPAVVIVHGSGPVDRNGTVGVLTPYADLASGLAGQGIAVLRYDKRTLVRRAELAAIGPDVTVADETIDDAVAAIDLLGQTDGIDPEAVFVLGHSLGGYLGPRILERSATARGLVVLAGNTRPLPDVILDQTTYLASLAGDPTPEVEQALAALRRSAEVAASSELSPSTPAAELPFGVPASYWLDLRDYDPSALAASLRRPLLVLRGDRDYQVTETDMDGWRAGLVAAPDVTFRTYPGLSHAFVVGDGPGTPQDYLRPGHVAHEVIDDIASWIRARS